METSTELDIYPVSSTQNVSTVTNVQAPKIPKQSSLKWILQCIFSRKTANVVSLLYTAKNSEPAP